MLLEFDKHALVLILLGFVVNTMNVSDLVSLGYKGVLMHARMFNHVSICLWMF